MGFLGMQYRGQPCMCGMGKWAIAAAGAGERNRSNCLAVSRAIQEAGVESPCLTRSKLFMGATLLQSCLAETYSAAEVPGCPVRSVTGRSPLVADFWCTALLSKFRLSILRLACNKLRHPGCAADVLQTHRGVLLGCENLSYRASSSIEHQAFSRQACHICWADVRLPKISRAAACGNDRVSLPHGGPGTGRHHLHGCSFGKASALHGDPLAA